MSVVLESTCHGQTRQMRLHRRCSILSTASPATRAFSVGLFCRGSAPTLPLGSLFIIMSPTRRSIHLVPLPATSHCNCTCECVTPGSKPVLHLRGPIRLMTHPIFSILLEALRCPKIRPTCPPSEPPRTSILVSGRLRTSVRARERKTRCLRGGSFLEF